MNMQTLELTLTRKVAREAHSALLLLLSSTGGVQFLGRQSSSSYRHRNFICEPSATYPQMHKSTCLFLSRDKMRNWFWCNSEGTGLSKKCWLGCMNSPLRLGNFMQPSWCYYFENGWKKTAILELVANSCYQQKYRVSHNCVTFDTPLFSDVLWTCLQLFCSTLYMVNLT